MKAIKYFYNYKGVRNHNLTPTTKKIVLSHSSEWRIQNLFAFVQKK